MKEQKQTRDVCIPTHTSVMGTHAAAGSSPRRTTQPFSGCPCDVHTQTPVHATPVALPGTASPAKTRNHDALSARRWAPFWYNSNCNFEHRCRRRCQPLPPWPNATTTATDRTNPRGGERALHSLLQVRFTLTFFRLTLLTHATFLWKCFQFPNVLQDETAVGTAVCVTSECDDPLGPPHLQQYRE